MKTLTFLLSLVVSLASVLAEPTEMRIWTSTSETTIEGKATSLTGQNVAFVTSENRKINVPLNKLVQEDQAYLKKHFAPKLSTPAELIAPADLPLEQGVIHGPIDAGNDSHYYLYLPKSLSQGYEAPLLFWTDAGGGKSSKIEGFTEGAELTGTIIATSVESKNGNNSGISNVDHSGQCLKHIEETLPVDMERVTFSGVSGGGATAFLNADTYPCMGVFSYVGYMPDSKVPKNAEYVFAAGGAWDYNRYLSAFAAKEFGENGTHRLTLGGHRSDRKRVDIEGLCWIYTREFYENQKGREEEKVRFESRFMEYLLDELVPNKPHLAYFWCDHLLNQCEVDDTFEYLLTELSNELASESQPYLDGRKALDKFSEDQFADLGSNGGSSAAHTNPKITSGAQKLIEEFGNVVEVGEIVKELEKPTAKF